MPRYAELVYYGFWFSPEREMLQALIDRSQRMSKAGSASSSTSAMSSWPGGSYRNCFPTPSSPFTDDWRHYQTDAQGFIRLNALRLRTLAARRSS
jgi:argininosuccinate synthase